jgi:drug/metabolite transporter (DMT)-like permease
MTQGHRSADLAAFMPVVFVLIWSTGFVVARFGMPHAPPMSFLAWRFALSVLAFGIWVLLARAAWPQGQRQWMHLAVVGTLMHAGYLGGVWSAVKLGIGAGTSALIVGLQPVLTALWIAAAGQGQRVSSRQWLGLLALLCITTATLYQKRYVEACDVRTASIVQLLAAFAVALPLALLESEPVQPVPALLGAMAWSVLALTLGGSSLLYMMVQRGAATRVSSLMYLVPPCTAVLAWLLFDELLTLRVLAGLALTALGVGLVVRAPMQPQSIPKERAA